MRVQGSPSAGSGQAFAPLSMTEVLVKSVAAYCFCVSCDFPERASVGCDGFRNGLVIDELSFAAAGDEFRFAENLEMVRDSRAGDTAHGDELATAHVVARRDSLKYPKTGFVGQGFRYFLNLRTVHGQLECSEVIGRVAIE